MNGSRHGWHGRRRRPTLRRNSARLGSLAWRQDEVLVASRRVPHEEVLAMFVPEEQSAMGAAVGVDLQQRRGDNSWQMT
jgi:hypothetical protein